MTETVQIRHLTIGPGKPAVCVPVVGMTYQEIIAETARIAGLAPDLVEWRADWFEEVFQENTVLSLLKELRSILQETPLLFTFRTRKEGGEKDISAEEYLRLNTAVVQSGWIDLLDVEYFTGKKAVKELIHLAHEHAVSVIVSSHDFQKTPSEEEMTGRLLSMRKSGADIAKLAVMPQSRKDVLNLLSSTLTVHAQFPLFPVVTMSMSEDGVISRLSGEVFGSSITFASAGRASAPGQIALEDMRTVLDILHKAMES